MRVVLCGVLLMAGAPALAADLNLTPGDDVVNIAQSLGPGSTITFASGVYELPDSVVIEAQGTQTAPIVLRAKEGAKPVFKLVGGRRLIYLRNAAHIEISGITLEGSDEKYATDEWYGGIYIENSANISLHDMKIHKLRSTGIALGGNNEAIDIHTVEVTDIVDGGALTMGCWDATCWTQDSQFHNNWFHDLGTDDAVIWLGPGCQNNEILDNVVYGNGNAGIQLYSTEYGPVNVVEGNVFWALDGDGIRVAGSSLVRNNIVFDVGGYGIYSENNRDTLEKVVITHNTVANTGSWGARLVDWAGRSGMVFANNAVTNPTGNAIRVDEGAIDASVRVIGNVATGLVSGLEEGMFGPGGGYLDFEDVDNWDFYPTNASTLRDTADTAGDSWVPAVDFNGFERNGEAPDVGAYEWVGSGNAGWQIREGFKEFEDGGGVESVTGCCKGKDKSPDEAAQEALLLLPFAFLVGLRRRRRR